MKKFIVYIFVFALVCLAAVGLYLTFNNQSPQSPTTITRIGIGGGGAFFNPMIDPTDEKVFYVTSDMGALYYSHNQGQTWDRSEARGVFTQTHISKNGVVFAGGYGVYSSTNKGEDLQLIYPKNVKYSVSRCGWNENLMLADDYNNGYVKCITTSEDNLFFVTLDWEGTLLLLKSDYNGDNLTVLYTELSNFKEDSVNSVDMYMLYANNGLYITVGNKICFYDFESNLLNTVYTTTGYINHLSLIDNNIFFIDDLTNQSLILYTNNFIEFNNLLDFNTLTNQFTKYGKNGTFNWHFKQIVGNNFNNIYLSFSSPVNEWNDTVDGIMKFNGTEFEWVFDSMYKTRFVTQINGWSYGSHGPFYGITSNPHNSNICLVANIETVYLMEYESEETKKIKTLHGADYNDGRFSTNGLDVQTTYFVKEDPFDKNHIIICTTDLGLQNSWDNGQTWSRMEITGTDYDIYNTFYDLYFDKFQKNLVYAVLSSRHDAPYNPTIYDKDYTKGAFAVSQDGGKTWDFMLDCGIPTDAIPVKMSISQTQDSFVIAVATFNRGFYISYDGGNNFVSINENMQTVEGLIFGEDIVLTDNIVYCLTAPYLENGYWKPSKLYEYNISAETTTNINLGDITLARSLTYHPQKGLYINVIPTYSYKWFEEYNNGSWVNENGGIYHLQNGEFKMFIENTDGIFYSTFSPDGKMYATDTYGKIYLIENQNKITLHEGLFNMLKNISFSSDGKIMYITTFGGGTYKIIN